MKKSILGALVTSALIGLVALAGCATGHEHSDGGAIDSRSIVGDYFGTGIWVSDPDEQGMWNVWDFDGNGNFRFTHYMSATEPVDVGTFAYTLDGTSFITTPAIPNSGASYTVIFNTDHTTFDISPEPYGMGGTHFVKQ